MSEKKVSVQQTVDENVVPFTHPTNIGPEGRLKRNAYVVFASDLENAQLIARRDNESDDLVETDLDEALRWIKS